MSVQVHFAQANRNRWRIRSSLESGTAIYLQVALIALVALIVLITYHQRIGYSCCFSILHNSLSVLRFMFPHSPSTCWEVINNINYICLGTLANCQCFLFLEVQVHIINFHFDYRIFALSATLVNYSEEKTILVKMVNVLIGFGFNYYFILL